MSFSSTDALRVGIVGAGFVATSHATALRGMSGANLVAIADADPARARAFAAEFPAEIAGSLDELLRRTDIDAVVLCTPNSTHADLGARVLDSGRHLLIEKPLALTADDARKLAEKATEAEVTLSVGHTHRHTDMGLAIHQALGSDVIEGVESLRITMTGGWIWGGWNSWMLNHHVSGGHALHNGVHLLDLAAWWGGAPITRVYALGQHATSGAMSFFDYFSVQAELANGVKAICEMSRAERPKNNTRVEVDITGKTGALQRAWDGDGILIVSENGTATLAPDHAVESSFRRQMESFVRASRGGIPDPPIAHAINAVSAAVAVERSLHSGEPEDVETIR